MLDGFITNAACFDWYGVSTSRRAARRGRA